MSLRILVYTCVFGGYDRIYPPVAPEPEIDYVLVTDDPTMQVGGWRTLAIDPGQFETAKAPNRYFKMLGHRRELSGYDVSIYVDGNIRVIGRLWELVDRFRDTGAAFASYRHPLRQSVQEEAACCLAGGKLKDAGRLQAELEEFRSEGFPDQQGLMETGVVLKNHHHPQLEAAMELWWGLFERYDSRDQIGLPYVQWKLGLPTWYIEPSYRLPNPHFGIYPHLGTGKAANLHAHVTARSYDSALHALVLRAWQAKWALQRSLRKRREA